MQTWIKRTKLVGRAREALRFGGGVHEAKRGRFSRAAESFRLLLEHGCAPIGTLASRSNRYVPAAPLVSLDSHFRHFDSHTMVTPGFHVSEADKLALIRSLMPQLFDALQAAAGPDGFTADDVIDVFALEMRLIIENDTNLTAPEQFREAAESAKYHISRRIEELRPERGDGASLVSLAKPSRR